MQEYDVIIIGAGPAGLMAARSMAGYNVSFLVIDAKRKIGRPLRCGEGIRKKGFIELFKDVKQEFVANETDKVEVRCGNVKRTFPAEFLILNRPKFEFWLADLVMTKIQLNTRMKDIIRHDEYLEIQTNKGALKAKMVILCNGCNYNIQKSLGVIEKEPMMIPCYGGMFKDHKKETNKIYFYIDEGNATISWIFPKDKTNANCGIGVVPQLRKERLDTLFLQFIKEQELKGKPSFSGVFPTSGPNDRTYAERVIVCGNAAGQVYAGMGEGIYFSLVAGKIAGEVAVKAVKRGDFKEKTLREYEKKWKKKMGKELYAGKVFAALLFAGFKMRKLERICGIPTEKELVDMFMKGKVSLRARIAHKLLPIGRAALTLRRK